MDAPVFYRRHPFCFYLDSFVFASILLFLFGLLCFTRILLFLPGLFCFCPDSVFLTWTLPLLPELFCFYSVSLIFVRIPLFSPGLFYICLDSVVFAWVPLLLPELFYFYLDSSAFTRTLLFFPRFFTFIIIYFCSAPIVKSLLVPIPLSIFHKHKSRQGKRHQFRCRSCQPDAVHPKEQRKHNHGDEHKYERPGKCKDSRNNPIG